MKCSSRIERAFDSWTATLDPQIPRELTSHRSWIFSCVFVALLLSVETFVPRLKNYFGFQIRPLALTFVPAALSAFAFSMWQSRRNTLDRSAWLVLLIGNAYVQFFCASFVTWSDSRAAGAAGSLFLAAAVYHGHSYRVTLRYPFMAFGTLAAGVAAALLNPSPDRLAVLSWMGGGAIGLELIAGTVAARQDATRRQTAQLQAAVRAQILSEQEREMRRLSDTLVEVLGRDHDLQNGLMAIQLNAEILQRECRRKPDDDLASVADALLSAVIRLKDIVAQSRVDDQVVRVVEIERIDAIPVLTEMMGSVGARFPSVHYRLSSDSAASLPVGAKGGRVTLQRIVENLLTNAAEGDGRRGASLVEIRAIRDPSGAIARVTIVDDGPGFSGEQLDDSVQAFRTTKRTGTGLGLYTSERLVDASGGSLLRSNRPGGGAEVTLSLPCAKVAQRN